MSQFIQSVLNISYGVMLPVVLIIGLAALLGRWLKFDLRLLSRLIIYLFTPCLVLQSLTGSDLNNNDISAILIMALIPSLLIWLIGWGISRLFKFSQKLESAFMLCILISNAGFLGFPVVEYGFGKSSLRYAVLFFAIVNIFTNSIGVYLASRGNSSIKKSIRNVFLVPLIYVTILGLGLNFLLIKLPLPVERVVTLLGQATVPTALVLMGLQLYQMQIKGKFWQISLASLIRLVIAPLVGFLIAWAMGISDVLRQVTITQLSMPTALFSAVFATEYGSDTDFVTAVILVTTLLGIVSLSILLAFLS